MKKLIPKDRKVPVKIDFEFSLFSLVRRFAGVAVIAILAYLYFDAKNQLAEQVTLQEAAVAEMEIWKDKDGLNNARIQSLETESAETFLKFASKDEAIVALQADVKKMEKYLKKQGSITNFATTTDVTATGETEIIENETDPELPTYKSQFEQKDDKGKIWAFGSVVATPDSTSISQKIFNEYSITIGREPQGFLGLGKSKAFGEVKNLNPFSETTTLRTYQVALPRPKRWVIGPSAGATFDGTIKPYIGVGVTYGLIKF